MNISGKTKEAYRGNSVHKNLIVRFPNLGITVDKKDIYQESMSLTESVLERNSIEFVGCISSKFSIQLNGITQNLKKQRIEVLIYADGTEDEPIPLFKGIVDSAVMQSNKQYKKITAYDDLYSKANKECASWYKSLRFPITLREIRNSIFNYIGIEQEQIQLPNDDIKISKQYDPQTLNALNIIKAICQINGAFGIINRQGRFEYRFLGAITRLTYPSATLFPANTFYPSNIQEAIIQRQAEGVGAEVFDFYRNINYEEYVVKPVDKVKLRESEEDAGVVFGTGDNTYIIQANIFAHNLSKTTKQRVVRNIYNKVQGFSYRPFTSSNNGLPWIEVGKDAVGYDVTNYWQTNRAVAKEPLNFYPLSRTLTGIQALKDGYSAKGEEEQSEFVTDLNTRVDGIKNSISDNYYNKEDLDVKFDNYDQQFEDFDYNFEEYDYNFEAIDTQFDTIDTHFETVDTNFQQVNTEFTKVWDAIVEGGGLQVESVGTVPPEASMKDNTIYLVQGELITMR